VLGGETVVNDSVSSPDNIEISDKIGDRADTRDTAGR